MRTLARQPVDRVPIYDWFWAETEQDFVRQIADPRLAAEIHSGSDKTHDRLTLWEYFDMDLMQVGWPDQRLRMVSPEVLEETDEWVLQRDGNGALLRWWKHKMGTPEHVDFTIKTPEQWAEVKPLLTASKDRIRWDEFRPRYQRAKERGMFVCFAGVEVIESVKDVLGHETMLINMIKRPEWIQDVFQTYAQFEADMFELFLSEGFEVDGAFIYGDTAYKNGPFMSPKHYRTFSLPAHKKFFEVFKKRGMPIIFHSDGDIRKILEGLIEAGVDMINPMESRAGMDVRELAPQYGDRLGFCGNIDVTVLATNDPDQIRPELHSKMKAAMEYGGYMYHSDHSIPPGVTLDTYRWLLDEVRRVGVYT